MYSLTLGFLICIMWCMFAYITREFYWNWKSHTEEWKDERFIEWLKRPLPEVKVDVGTIHKNSCVDYNYWKSGWIIDIFPVIKDTYIGKSVGDDLRDLIHNYDREAKDIVQFFESPIVSSYI